MNNFDALFQTFEDPVLKKEVTNSFTEDFKTMTTAFCMQPVLQETHVASVLFQETASDTGNTAF